MFSLRSLALLGGLLSVVGCDNFNSFSSDGLRVPPPPPRVRFFDFPEDGDVPDLLLIEDETDAAIAPAVDASDPPPPKRDAATPRDSSVARDLRDPDDLSEPVDLIVPPDLACPMGGVCKPGDTRQGNCDACSQEVCGNDCQWSGSCALRFGNECLTGAKRPCGCKKACQFGNNFEMCVACKWVQQCICYCVGNNCIYC